MMHVICLTLSFLLLPVSASAEAFRSPDILIDSKLDYDWSEVLVKKLRLILKNYNVSDPFQGNFPGQMVVNEAEIQNLLTEDSKHLIKTFGEAVGLNILRGKTKVSLHDLSYEVKGFKTNLRASDATADGLVMGTDISATEISLSAGKISIGLVIPGKNNSPVFNVDIINPMIRAQGEDLIHFFTELKVQDNRSFFKLQILKASFDKMANNLVADAGSIDLDYERLVIPDVSLKVGNKIVNFSPEKIENLIRSKHEAIKGILLAQVTQKLNTDTSDALHEVLNKFKIEKEYWILTDLIRTQLNLGSFSTAEGENNIEINMPGDFCTIQNFDKNKKECIKHKITKTADSRMTRRMHDESVSKIKNLMNRGDANIVASVSEDYINKLLVTTIDAGLWQEGLDEAGVTLGPNKVIMRLDKKGDSGTVIMDVIYKPSKMEKFLTGSREIRFPLVLDMNLRIDVRDGIPFVVIHLKDVDTSDETLINGKPMDKIISTVKDVPRFKKKVAKAIREKVSILRNKDMLELPYPQYRGVGLDKVEFISDGKGRMNAYLRLEDLLEE